MNGSSRSYDLLWLSIALLPLVGLSVLLSVPSQDYWWYLRLGSDILARGSVPVIDTMGYSRAGLPIFYQQWLSGIIFFLVYQWGGAALTFLLRGVLIGGAYGMVWIMMRTWSGPRTASILLVLAGLATSNNWVMRPQLFAYPLFVIGVWVIYEWQQGKDRLLFLLPVVTMLWANLHGSFVLPFILAGSALWVGSGNRKNMLLAVGAMGLASLLNPHGVGVWRYLVFILNNPSDYLFSVEWRAPSNAGWQMNIFFAWMLGFAPLATFSKNKLTPLEWVWFLGFGWLAFSGIRYVIWFVFLLGIITARLCAGWSNLWIDKPIEKFNPQLNVVIAFFLFLTPLVLLPGVREGWWRGAPPVYEATTTPVNAVEFLKIHKELTGPLWNDYAFGSYLEFTLPALPTWMDTRMYSFSQEQWNEYVRTSRAENWQAMFDREGINLLILSRAAQPELVEAVTLSEDWCEEYYDDVAVIFSRCEVK